MSGVGNTATGSTIFSDNTVSGGPNDVAVSNLIVEQDLRVDGNFEVGTFTIDDLTVNNNLIVDDNLTVGDNIYANYVETVADANVKGSLFLENNIVGNGLSYDRPLKRLRVDNGADVADVLSNAVTVTNGSITNTHDHNKITIANTGSTRVGHIHLTTTELEVGTTTNHPVEILVNNAPVATAQTNGCVRIGPGALGDVAGARLILVNQTTSMNTFNQGTVNNESVFPLKVMGKTRRFITAAGDDSHHMYYGAYSGSGADPDFVMCMRQGTGIGICNGGINMPPISKQLHVFGDQEVTGSTASSSTTTGALVVTGGVGIGGAVNVGGITKVLNSTASSSATTGCLVASGGLGVAGAINTAGAIKTTNTTGSTSTTTGALIVGGGAGFNGNINALGINCTGISTYTGQGQQKIVNGTASMGNIGAGNNATQAVTFPAGVFTTTPTVTTSCTGSSFVITAMIGLTAAGFTANARNTHNQTVGPVTVHYIAIGS